MKVSKSLAQMDFNKVIIYYFSGTGNSRNVAEWFRQVAETNGIPCFMVNIAQTERRSIAPPDPEAQLLFVSPIHGFNYPPVMLHFIMHFPKGKNKVVLMNTRAGMLIGKFITPGLTGIAFYLSGLLLKMKGFSIRGILPVDMPSNWISVHPGLNHRTVKYLHERNRERVEVFAHRILKGKTCFKALIEVYDLLLAPIALGYYFVGRFIFAKTYYASADCNNCGSCSKGCPVKAITLVDDRPFWTFSCESCMKCMGNCQKNAIETAHGSILLFSLIFSLGFLALFYKYFDLYFPAIENSMVKMVVESGLFLALLSLWYRLVHWAMRFKAVERFMVYTSLTKYKWWGRRYRALAAHQYQSSSQKNNS